MSGDYAALTQAMHGLGGVGKTQTSIEYAYRYASEYDAVLWIPAEDTTAFAGHFSALATQLGLDVDLADQPATIDAVHRWLREHTRWLLIFDNAEAAGEIQPYLPHAGSGRVIITSRNPEWRRVAKPLPVQQFASEEAVAFLLLRIGRDAADENERTAAVTLAEELGGLALALEQAAAYVETRGLSLTEYLRFLQKYQHEVLSGDPSPDYPHTVGTVWTISFAAVRSTSQAAAELLSLLACFAPDDVPLSLLGSGAEAFPQALSKVVTDELKLREVIRVLRRYSLVEVDEDGVSVHRVVQAVTRNAFSEKERSNWIEAAITTLSNALPDDAHDVHTWSAFSRLSSPCERRSPTL